LNDSQLQMRSIVVAADCPSDPRRYRRPITVYSLRFAEYRQGGQQQPALC
jgi:hypothetical protein